MSIQRELTRKIERKSAEIAELREKRREHIKHSNDLLSQILQGRAYILALEETMKLLPKADAATDLRPNSALALAREAILRAGKPLQINELLQALGKPTDHASRASLSGSLAAYVRNNEIFTRPAPNTFGLVELDPSQPKSGDGEIGSDSDEPPDDFGTINGKSPKEAADME
jgi:hypothetical protein